MTGPTFAPVDADTAELLKRVAPNDPAYARFLLACKADAEQNGRITVNSVRRRLAETDLLRRPRNYSAMWSRATAKDGPMVTTTRWEFCDDRRGRNVGKPQRIREWVG